MIDIKSDGSFDSIERALRKMAKPDIESIFNQYGQEGVNALSEMTPQDTGLTAHSWGFRVEVGYEGVASITWTNSHIVDGRPIAIMLQYGHGTGTGGYVEGRDYINPAIQPIFDLIAEAAWKVVTNS